MDFLKKLFFKQKSYTKYGDILKKTATTKEQRLEAIDVLENLSADLAVPELLKRFELVVESGLQDTKEKEYCLNAIIKHSVKAQPYVTQYIQTKKRLAWVIRISEKIFSKDEHINLLLNSLAFDFVEFDDDAMERNLDILHALKEFQDPTIASKISKFLNSRDDDTRLAALECLESQAETDTQARAIILNLAQNHANDINSRFMGAVTHIIEKHHWSST
jgi:hypothetical protein